MNQFSHDVEMLSVAHFDRLHAITWAARCAAQGLKDIQGKMDDANEALAAARSCIQKANDECNFDNLASYTKAAQKSQKQLEALRAKFQEAEEVLRTNMNYLDNWESVCQARPEPEAEPEEPQYQGENDQQENAA